MRMLKHTETGRLYVYHEGLAAAEGVEEVIVAEDGPLTAPPVIPEAPERPEDSLFDDSPVGDEWPQPEPEAPKSLDEMTRDELIAMANAEEKLRGDNRNLSRLKKSDLIAYIKGEGA